MINSRALGVLCLLLLGASFLVAAPADDNADRSETVVSTKGTNGEDAVRA